MSDTITQSEITLTRLDETTADVYVCGEHVGVATFRGASLITDVSDGASVWKWIGTAGDSEAEPGIVAMIERAFAGSQEPAITIHIRWDDQPGVTPGWHVEIRDADGCIADSQKIGFPIDVEDFGPDEREKLEAAISEQWWCATIEGGAR